MSEGLTPDAQLDALTEMVQSVGWQVYMQHVEAAWGPVAMEAALRAAKQNSTPEEWPFDSTRILDTFEAMRADLRWPEAQIEVLRKAVKRGDATGVFDKWRRGPR
jgi:hypothetical protein